MNSIEWLGFQLNSKLFDKVSSEEWEEINDIFKLAHKKHKQEIIDAWMATDNELQRIAAEQYYNETFNQQ